MPLLPLKYLLERRTAPLLSAHPGLGITHTRSPSHTLYCFLPFSHTPCVFSYSTQKLHTSYTPVHTPTHILPHSHAHLYLHTCILTRAPHTGSYAHAHIPALSFTHSASIHIFTQFACSLTHVYTFTRERGHSHIPFLTLRLTCSHSHVYSHIHTHTHAQESQEAPQGRHDPRFCSIHVVWSHSCL